MLNYKYVALFDDKIIVPKHTVGRTFNDIPLNPMFKHKGQMVICTSIHDRSYFEEVESKLHELNNTVHLIRSYFTITKAGTLLYRTYDQSAREMRETLQVYRPQKGLRMCLSSSDDICRAGDLIANEVNTPREFVKAMSNMFPTAGGYWILDFNSIVEKLPKADTGNRVKRPIISVKKVCRPPKTS